MRNTFGNHLTLTLFGESHGPEIGCVLDGLEPGLPVEEARISLLLRLRRPAGPISTARVEPDPFRIVSGVWNGRTTGAPLCILIPNTQMKSGEYRNLADTPRPGHADYPGYVKSNGCADPRGGGHFSGRLTAALTAAGAIVLPSLERRGIRIGTRIARCGGVPDRDFADLSADLAALAQKPFPVLDEAAAEAMRAAILAAAADGDSVGGILETVATGLPAGLGEPWFDTVEGLLSHALFSIPAVKGVEFGSGFAFSDLRGSQADDPFRMQGGAVVTEENHNGGALGGLTTGMPLRFRTVVKPTPTIARPRRTVDLRTGENVTVTASGRHDPSIVPRAAIVQTAVTALVLYDLLLGDISG